LRVTKNPLYAGGIVLPSYEQYPVHTNGCARRRFLRSPRVFMVVKPRSKIGPWVVDITSAIDHFIGNYRQRFASDVSAQRTASKKGLSNITLLIHRTECPCFISFRRNITSLSVTNNQNNTTIKKYQKFKNYAYYYIKIL